jgi:hypothetical protein
MGMAGGDQAQGKTRTVLLLVAVVAAFFVGFILRRWLWA